MTALGFFPSILKEILTHIPTIAFKTVRWGEFLKRSKPILAQMTNPQQFQSQYLHLQQSLSPLLPPNMSFSQELSGEKSIKGEDLLFLYFSQLKSTDGVFLDLRPHHFSCYQDKTLWRPNFIWVKFEEPFRQSLIELYRGFYQEDDQLFSQSLIKIGLGKNLSTNEFNELKTLFLNHFGEGDQTKVNFNLRIFQKSFTDLFQFFLKHKIVLESDFLYLGVYLVSLYLHLEKNQQSYDVRGQYLKVFSE